MRWFAPASNLIVSEWNTATYIEPPTTGNLDSDYESVTNRIDTAGKSNEFIRPKIQAP